MLGPDYFKTKAAAFAPLCYELRCYLHRNPELSFKEKETSQYLKKFLMDRGIQVDRAWVETGFTTRSVFSSSKKSIGIRCELDALPIQEKNEVPYASVRPGVMHACGHDFHTAAVVGTLLMMQEIPSLEGSLVGIFQPGEEKLPGGASVMIEEGLLRAYDLDVILAQHVTPEIPEGRIGFRSGEFMASSDELYFTVTGKGGHAAMPARYKNPIPVLSELIMLLTEKFPPGNHVLAIGQLEAAGATNVIPDAATAAGTLRTFDETWREKTHEDIRDLCRMLSNKSGLEVYADIRKGYPSLVNDVQLTEKVKELSKTYFGESSVIDLEPRMTAEDFAYFSRKLPVCFYRLGTGNSALGMQHGVHTPHFDASLRALEHAIGFMGMSVYQLLMQE